MARDFSGTSQYVLFPTAPSSGHLTACLWFYSDVWTFTNAGDTGYHGMLVKGVWGSNGDGDFSFYVDPAGHLHFDLFTSAGGTGLDVAGDKSGAWHHACGTYNDTTDAIKLYIDGIEVASGSFSGTRGSNTRNVCIASFDNALTTNEFDGRICEAAFWNNVVLSPDAVVSLSKGFSPLHYNAGITFYAPLIGQATTELNLAGSAASTTLGSAADHPRIYYPANFIPPGQQASLYEFPLIHITQELLETAYQDSASLAVNNARITQELIEASYQDSSTIAPNYARLTEELVEAVYRDPLVPGPSIVTQELIEVASSYSGWTPTNAVRLTQQTVEVLWLEPETEPVFDDCGNFSGLREWEIRVYDHMDPSTGKRKAFGSAGYDLQSVVSQLNFEIQERGGYGSGACEFIAGWDEVSLAGTERVDVYLWDEPAYRGYLRIAQKSVASPESANPQFYGMVAILDQWKVKRKYAYGCATDVATIARDIALDYVAVSGRFPSVSLDMSTAVGATLKEYDGRGKSIAQAFNELADMAPNQAIWGAVMDNATPVPGDILYFKPKPTATSYVVPVGDNVQAFTYPSDTHEIVNSLAPLKGGAVLQPNLAINGSFEEVKPASEYAGNLLLNYSFEDATAYWSFANGASVKQTGGSGATGTSKTGNWWLELDTTNEEAAQTVNIIPLGHYEASLWARLEFPANTNTGYFIVEGYDAFNVLIVTSATTPLTGLSGIYQRFTVDMDLASHATVTKLKFRVGSNGGTESFNGILVDDCGIYEYCADAQETWRVLNTGNAVIDEFDWASEAVTARTGEYSVRINCSGISVTADTGELYYLPSESPDVKPEERYTIIAWWRTDGTGTPADSALTIGAVSIKSDNTQDTVWESDTAVIPGSGQTDWQMIYKDFVTNGDTAKLQLFVRVRTNTVMYIDDVMLVEGEVPSEVQSKGGYWPGDTYQRYIDVTETVVNSNGDAFNTMLDTNVSSSITNYGEHEDDPSNDLVTDLDTALAYASGQFNAKALPKVQARLEIFGARKLIGQEGKLRIVNIPNAPDALFPSRSNYTISAEAINCSVELGDQRPDLASLLLLTTDRSRKGLV